jgi:predicted SAM-dependent methyltransferase
MSAIAMGLDKYNDVNEFYCNHDGEHLTGVEELIVAKEMY